jgi:protein-S-isoprenylcysteine O-methyltransferase Ste14
MITTILLLCCWAALHSLSASSWFKGWWAGRLGARMAFYRLGYNVFSVVTLGAALFLIPRDSTILYELASPLREGFVGAQVVWSVLFLVALKDIHLSQLMGISQIRDYFNGSYSYDDHRETGIEHELVTGGLYRISRHPIYLFAILALVFKPTVTVMYAGIMAMTILYFYIGSVFEERRLVREYGEQYRSYQRRVGRIIPFL